MIAVGINIYTNRFLIPKLALPEPKGFIIKLFEPRFTTETQSHREKI
jgi:hypothetical protein